MGVGRCGVFPHLISSSSDLPPKSHLFSTTFPKSPLGAPFSAANFSTGRQGPCAQSIEVQTQNHFLENPENHNAFLDVERAAAEIILELEDPLLLGNAASGIRTNEANSTPNNPFGSAS